MTARQPILVPCQGFPVVVVSVHRDKESHNRVLIDVTPKDRSMAGWTNPTELQDISLRIPRTPQKVSVSLGMSRLKVNLYDTFSISLDQMAFKSNQKRRGEFSISELFAKHVVIEQIGSEEQVVLATVDRDQGILLTCDRVVKAVSDESPIGIFDTSIQLSPLEVTVTSSIIDDIERVVSLFKSSFESVEIQSTVAQSIIARSGTPYYLTVDIATELARARKSICLEMNNLRVSDLTVDVWSELAYNRSKFVSSEIRLILSILSLSDSLKLEGARISLPTEHFFKQDWRGSRSEFWSTIGDVYKNSLAENVSSFSLVSSSNVLNVVGAGLFRSAREKSVNRKFE
jgi:hypothetical protein